MSYESDDYLDDIFKYYELMYNPVEELKVSCEEYDINNDR